MAYSVHSPIKLIQRDIKKVTKQIHKIGREAMCNHRGYMGTRLQEYNKQNDFQIHIKCRK